MEICKMVSLDTSTTISGYAYFENGKLISSGILNHSKEKDIEIRLEDMCIDLINLLNKYNPHIVVIEKPPFKADPKTLTMLAEIIGCVKGWSLTTGYSEYVEIYPSTWRSLVAVKGETIPKRRNDCKPWDKTKAMAILGREPIDDNEADAVLIGIARIKEFER